MTALDSFVLTFYGRIGTRRFRVYVAILKDGTVVWPTGQPPQSPHLRRYDVIASLWEGLEALKLVYIEGDIEAVIVLSCSEEACQLPLLYAGEGMLIVDRGYLWYRKPTTLNVKITEWPPKL